MVSLSDLAILIGKECGLDLTNHVDKFVIVTFIDDG